MMKSLIFFLILIQLQSARQRESVHKGTTNGRPSAAAGAVADRTATKNLSIHKPETKNTRWESWHDKLEVKELLKKKSFNKLSFIYLFIRIFISSHQYVVTYTIYRSRKNKY